MKKQELLNNLKNVIMERDQKKFKKIIAQKQYIKFIIKPYLLKGMTMEKIQFNYSDLKEICGDNTREEMLLEVIEINYNKHEFNNKFNKGGELWNEKIIQVYELVNNPKQEIDINVIKFLIKLKNRYPIRHRNPIEYDINTSVLENQILYYGTEHGENVLNMLMELHKEGYNFNVDFQCTSGEEDLIRMKEVETLNPSFIKKNMDANNIFYSIEDKREYNNRHLISLLFMSYINNNDDVEKAMQKSGIKNKNKYDSIFIFKDFSGFSSKMQNNFFKKAFKQKFGYEFKGDIVAKDKYYTDIFLKYWSDKVLEENPILKQMVKKDILNRSDYDVLRSIILEYHLESFNLEKIIKINHIQELEGVPICGEINILGYNKNFVDVEKGKH